MRLLTREYKQLEEIQGKIISDTASPNEKAIFLDLIVKSGNESEMLKYMQILGFNTIEDVKSELKKQTEDSGINTGLVIAGGAILLALLFSK